MCGLRKRHSSACPTHCSVEAVGHELALAVGGNEGDGAVVLEA